LSRFPAPWQQIPPYNREILCIDLGLGACSAFGETKKPLELISQSDARQRDEFRYETFMAFLLPLMPHHIHAPFEMAMTSTELCAFPLLLFMFDEMFECNSKGFEADGWKR
jgi:hypothetical protein